MKAVLMPALGVAMTEGLVLRWLKEPGDSVVEGESVLEIETDKSAVEVPSPASGILGPLLFPEGAMVPTGVAVTHVSDGSDEVVETVAVAPPVTPSTDDLVAEAPAQPAGALSAASAVSGARTPHLLSPRQRRLAREAAAGGTTSGSASAPSAPVAGSGTAGRYRSLIASRSSNRGRPCPTSAFRARSMPPRWRASVQRMARRTDLRTPI